LIYKTLIVNQIKQLKIFYSKKNKKLNFKTIKLIKICKKLIYKTVQKLIFINKKIEKSIIFIKKNLNLYLTKRIKSGFKMYRQELKLLKFHQKLRLFCENNFKFYKKFLRNLGFRYSIDLFFYYKFEKGGIVLDGPSPRFRTYKRKGLIISI
jgi:hypothetical protein